MLNNTPYRWLNISTFSERLLALTFPEFTLGHIRYFTALVAGKPTDTSAPDRQLAYLKALGTLDNVTIHRGQFKQQHKTYLLADGSGYAEVIRPEEKGSDVNLASMLIVDGMDDCYDVALVVSNDTDLLLPISLVRDRFAKAVGVAAPMYHRDRRPNIDLVRAADFTSHITKEHKALLAACQFPEMFEVGDSGTIYRPARWAPPGSGLRT